MREQMAVHSPTRRTTEDHIFPSKLPNSSIRYRPMQPEEKQEIECSILDPHRIPYGYGTIPGPPVPTRRRSLLPPVPSPKQKETKTEPVPIPKKCMHWSIILGSGMVLMMLLSMGMNWVADRWEDWTYGTPRTFQIDQQVGHNDAGTPSHFLALNLKGQIFIVEFPGGNAQEAKVYQGPRLNNEETPVTLRFQDINGDSKLDLIGVAGGIQFIFLNEKNQFRPAKPEELNHL